MIAVIVLASLLSLPGGSTQSPQSTPTMQSAGDAGDRDLRHQSPEWLAVAPHLPDPHTATPEALALSADVLRARRLPEDALDYYQFALQRGGDEAKLVNSIGVTLLELNRTEEAHTAFKRAVKLRPKDAQDWNNLGASEYIAGHYRAALEDYLRAVKLDKKAAVFHSNLGTVYFELQDYESARTQFAKAMQLDPNIFHGGGWAGVQAHVLSTHDQGRFCFEMAKMAARQHDDPTMIHWLARSSEAGFDVRAAMDGDKDFAPYLKDARIDLVIRNAHAMRTGQMAKVNAESPLPPPQ